MAKENIKHYGIILKFVLGHIGVIHHVKEMMNKAVSDFYFGLFNCHYISI